MGAAHLEVCERGHAHPAVLAAARAVMREGWRVTSIFRPCTSGGHSRGIALDVAPLLYSNGGFGPRTAQLVWDVVSRAAPDVPWVAIAENDHVHVEIREPAGAGVLTPQGVVMNLPEWPVGDAFEAGGDEFGDPEYGGDEIGAAEFGDPEFGDPEYGGDEWGDPEMGNPRVRGRASRVRPRGRAGSAARGRSARPTAPRPRAAAASAGAGRSPMAGFMGLARTSGARLGATSAVRGLTMGHTSQLRSLVGANPGLARAASTEAAIRRAAQPGDVYFVHVDGTADRIAGPVPLAATLRPAEVRAVAATFFQNQPFTPRVFGFPVVGPNFQLDVDSSLSTTNQGPLANGTLWTWMGQIIEITSSLLNSQPLQITILVTVNATTSFTYTYRLAPRTNLVRFNTMHGDVLNGAMPRVRFAPTTVAAVASGTSRIVVSGLATAVFTVGLRHFVSGDAQVEAFLRLVG